MRLSKNQEIGETRDAILGDNEKRLREILNANSTLTDPYWIVIFAKPAKGHIDGKPALIQHIKAYKTKPQSMVGMIIGKVDNKTSSIDWEINMPQAPLNLDSIKDESKKEQIIVETTKLQHSYLIR